MSKLIVPKTTTALRTAHVQSAGELIWDTDAGKFFAGDGVTPGGVEFGGIVTSTTVRRGRVNLDGMQLYGGVMTLGDVSAGLEGGWSAGQGEVVVSSGADLVISGGNIYGLYVTVSSGGRFSDVSNGGDMTVRVSAGGSGLRVSSTAPADHSSGGVLLVVAAGGAVDSGRFNTGAFGPVVSVAAGGVLHSAYTRTGYTDNPTDRIQLAIAGSGGVLQCDIGTELMVSGSGARVDSASLTKSCGAHILAGGSVTSVHAENSAVVAVSSGGSAGHLHLSGSHPRGVVESSGFVTSLTVGSAASASAVPFGRVGSGVVERGGVMFITGDPNWTPVLVGAWPEAYVSNLTVQSGGGLEVSRGGGASGVTVESGGTVHISSGGVVYALTSASGATVVVDSGGYYTAV